MSQASASSSNFPEVGTLVAAVGEAVRGLRKERGYTLELLAERSRLSTGILSQLERGNGNPSFATLVQIAHGLDVPIGRLLHIDEHASPVVRRAERRRVEHHGVPEILADYEMLTPDLNGALQATWVTARPGHDTSATPSEHNGEEFGIVLSGTITVTVDETTYELSAGDSIRFASSRPHSFANNTDITAEAIWVSTPPTW